MVTVATNLGPFESARRVRFEPGESISATDVQEAIEEVASEAAVTTPTVVTASGAIAVADVVVQTNQAAAIALTLPAAAAWQTQNSKHGLPLSIFDISGTGATNNVTITPDGAETINGLASLTISGDYDGYRLMPKTGGWVVV